MRQLTIDYNIILLLDDADYEVAKNYKWIKENKSNFIYTRKNKRKVPLTEVLFSIQKGHMIFHKNDNIFDFRRDQILIVTRQEYFHMVTKHYKKSSKYLGVYYDSTNKKFGVNKVKNKRFFGGRYNSEEEAAIAADYLSIELYGEKAELNFPELSYEQLSEKFNDLEKKYGISGKDKISKSVQGRAYKAESKTSKYVGVNRVKSGKWAAEISFMNKRYWLGTYEVEEDAAKAYDKKALELYGEHAKLNFPITL